MTPDAERIQRALHAMHARRARLRRNRIFLGSAAALLVVIVAVAGSVALSSTPDRRNRIVVTNPTSTSNTTTTPTTEVTVPPSFPVPLPPFGEIANAQQLYAQQFPWGDGEGQVGFIPGRQGAPSAPSAFHADRDGNVAIFDVVNDRLVARLDGEASTHAIDLRGFGVVAATVDAQHRLIVSSGEGGLTVYSAGGTRVAHYPANNFPAADFSHSSIVAEGSDVFADASGSRLRLLHDDGTAYRPIPNSEWQSPPVEVRIAQRPNGIPIDAPKHPEIAEAQGTRYSIRAPWHLDTYPATRVLPDGTIVSVLLVDNPANVTPIGDPIEYHYLILAIDRLGHATVEQFPAPITYMDDGPTFQLTDDFFAVMSDTEQGGVTVAAYRYPTPGGVPGDRTAAGSIPRVEELLAEGRLPYADSVQRAWADVSVIVLTTTLTDRTAAQELYEQLSRHAGCDDSYMLVSGYRVELQDGSTVTEPRPEFVTCAGT